MCLQSDVELSFKHRSGWVATPWIQYQGPVGTDRMYTARIHAQADHSLPAGHSATAVVGVMGSRLGEGVIAARDEVRCII